MMGFYHERYDIGNKRIQMGMLISKKHCNTYNLTDKTPVIKSDIRDIKVHESSLECLLTIMI